MFSMITNNRILFYLFTIALPVYNSVEVSVPSSKAAAFVIRNPFETCAGKIIVLCAKSYFLERYLLPETQKPVIISGVLPNARSRVFTQRLGISKVVKSLFRSPICYWFSANTLKLLLSNAISFVP